MGNAEGPEPRRHLLLVPRTARYFTLGEPGPDATELWIACHGYLQAADRFLQAFAPASRPGRVIVAPEGLSRAYVDGTQGSVGASWMTRVEREEEIADYIRFLDLVAADLVPRLSASALHVEVHGFSQGAATAARWAVNGALAVDRLVLWGGGVPPDLDLKRLREALRAPLHLMVGDEDPHVTLDAVTREAARLDHAGVPHRVTRFAGGHRVDVSALPTT